MRAMLLRESLGPTYGKLQSRAVKQQPRPRPAWRPRERLTMNSAVPGGGLLFSLLAGFGLFETPAASESGCERTPSAADEFR